MAKSGSIERLTYGPNFPILKGSKCMVFVDWKEPHPPGRSGSRFLFGKVVDVFRNVITVEIIDSSFSDYLKHDQIFFNRYQIWPQKMEAQMSLFDQPTS